ncbi:MAG: molybdopterin-dependent oxidoreductase [Candidatus Aminicenantes bacterium]|nr:molybdopterin-dependent oxidoreductase [Candidatus Aminicenantes bacterium]
MKKDERDEYQRPGTLGRREFLKIAGGGIVVAVSFGGEFSFSQEEARRRGAGYPEDFNAYLLIGADGRVTGYTGKVELGQGAITSLPQMIADELDVPYQAVDMVMGDTDLCPWDMGTFGSLTTRMFGPALRAAAAEARAVLLELAAERLKVPKESLSVKDGVVFDKASPSNKVFYGELASGKRIERHISPKPSVKGVGEWAVMGKPFFHKDAVDKVTGKALFAGDIRLPGMLYAKVLRPPAQGAKIRSLDTSAADRIEGIRIVQDGDLVAALHELPDVAATALDLIKAEYDVPESKLDDETIFDHLLSIAPEARVVAEGGDLKEGESLAANVFEETYLNGYVAHAPMEPHTALADVKGDKATIWASTQAPFRVKDEVAQAVGIPPAGVHVVMPFVGGGFGGKTRNIQASQAARLSKITGKPVQVAWSREDEFFNDSFRPAAIVKIRSGTDGSGKMVFWDYGVYFAGDRSSAQFYSIPHHRTVSRGEWGGGGTGAHPFAVGAWRAPGSNTNVFARECQIDIMAAKEGMDPLEFRMQNLSDERMKRVLAAAADKFGWTLAPLPSRRGMAIVCADYSGTYVATAAQITVDRKTGGIQVNRVVCAQDMGQCINPQGAVIQIEGCITMGLGYTLTEELHFKGGEILDLNFDTYELPRFSWLPKIETVLVPNNSLPPSGGGEPAIINMGAVVANALFDATGARVRRLPLTPKRVKAALAAMEK